MTRQDIADIDDTIKLWRDGPIELIHAVAVEMRCHADNICIRRAMIAYLAEREAAS